MKSQDVCEVQSGTLMNHSFGHLTSSIIIINYLTCWDQIQQDDIWKGEIKSYMGILWRNAETKSGFLQSSKRVEGYGRHGL